MSAEITITIDGVEIPAEPGQTIMQAADAAGIYIPRLCYHADLFPGGHCRICTVKVNGRPTNSCTFPVDDGLIIENDTEELNALRRNIVEMLFVEGNHHCPTCEESGRCELQALAYRLGLTGMTLPYLLPDRDVDATHPDVYMDHNRCVRCGRCVRSSVEIDKKGVFGFENRGARMRVAVGSSKGLGGTDLTAEDKAPDYCPTGALERKHRGYDVPYGRRKYDTQPIGSDIEQKATT